MSSLIFHRKCIQSFGSLSEMHNSHMVTDLPQKDAKMSLVKMGCHKYLYPKEWDAKYLYPKESSHYRIQYSW